MYGSNVMQTGRQALNEANELLVQEETARQMETRERIYYRNTSENLAMQLKSY